MNTKAFIKVTPKGEKKSHILPAGNASFYTSQGATISTPTEEEILKAYPELAKKGPATVKSSIFTAEEVAEQIAVYESKIAGKDETIAQLEAKNAELQTRIDELDKKLAEMIAEAEEALKENEEAIEDAEDAPKTKKSKK